MMKWSPPIARYCAWTAESPATESAVATVSAGRFHRAFYGDSTGRDPVDCREGKRFRFSVIPAESRKNANVGRNRLLRVDSESVFQIAGMTGERDIGSGMRLLGEANRLTISSGVSMQQRTQ